MGTSFCSSSCGVAQVDACNRRGHTNFYDLERQLVTLMPRGEDLDSNQVEVKVSMCSDGSGYEKDFIINISATWVALATALADINNHSLVFNGDDSTSFDPFPGTIHFIGQVLEKSEEGR
ncbi:hypothetical protein OC834_006097, partial [Tilletia horrida]